MADQIEASLAADAAVVAESASPCSLAERLKLARAAANLTQPELAAMTGLTQASISDLERGKSLETVRSPQLAHALGVSALWLVTGEGRMTEGSPASPLAKRRAAVSLEELQRAVSAKVTHLIQSGELDAAAWQFLDDTMTMLSLASAASTDSLSR